jgi:hypothetical protein
MANPGPQESLLTCPAWEVLYGGARGGGKTDGLLMDFAQEVGKSYGPYWKGILFRKTYTQLEDVIERSKLYFYKIFPGAKYNETDHIWHFPTGEILKFRYLRRDADVEHYQGHQYPWIGFEELTNWPTPHCYEKMKACSRSNLPGMPRKIRASANPLGVGHTWVKYYFIDPAPALTPIFNNQGLVRVYIPARVYDNPAVMENDPEYVARLESIKDENLRRAWLQGDWDVVPGGFFAGVWDRDKLTLPNFYPPPGWILFRAFDYGSAHPFSVGWWAIADGSQVVLPNGKTKTIPRGARVRWGEWYGMKKDEPNVGIAMSSTKIAEGILSREEKFRAALRAQLQKKAWKLLVHPGPAGSDIFDTGRSDQGPTIAQKMARKGVPWVRADTRAGSRIQGWDTVRDLMERERMFIMERCVHWLRTVPVLQRDENIWDDVDTESEDHCGDSARYASQFKGPKIASGSRYWK